jgi:hypothetical protein
MTKDKERNKDIRCPSCGSIWWFKHERLNRCQDCGLEWTWKHEDFAVRTQKLQQAINAVDAARRAWMVNSSNEKWCEYEKAQHKKVLKLAKITEDLRKMLAR